MTTLDLADHPLDLRARLEGAVLQPGDAGYDDARAGFNLAFDQRPALIVEPLTGTDVAEAVRFAARRGLRVSVHATGHGPARPADGALMIATHRLTGVTVDPAARTARIQAGARWSAVLGPAQEHGLAPLVGSTTHVGAVGYTLGGGLGWLGRRYGLASDLVRSFDLVTPEGLELTCSADENPEVFWALRGGGAGSLGVVTAMEIELVPVTTVYAGNLVYPATMAREVARRWRSWVDGMDERLTSSLSIMNFPDVEILPEPLRGQSFVMVRGAWCGPVAEGAALIDTWREWRAPAMDLFGEMPFAAADTISNDPTTPMPVMVTNEWFETLPDEAIDVVVAATVPVPGRPPALVFSEFRHVGGAVRRGAAVAANDRGRSGEFLLEMGGLLAGPDATALPAHLRLTREKLAPFVTGAAYLNFLEGEEKARRSAAAFSPQHRERLRRVKAALDPQGRFAHGVAL